MPAHGVAVIGVDGVRHDTLQEVDTPHIDSIAKSGFLSSFTVSDQTPVNSGPLWATIATGVWPTFHGVYDNSLAGNRLAAFPDFLAGLTMRVAGPPRVRRASMPAMAAQRIMASEVAGRVS